MFSLNDIIAKKKRSLGQNIGNEPPTKRQKRYKTRREIEEEKEKAKQQELLKQTANNTNTIKSSITTDSNKINKNENIKENQHENNDLNNENKSLYNRDDVIKRLRQAGLVVTYFGESDRERELRWLKYNTESKEDFAYNKGTKNDFDDLMRNLDNHEDNENKKEVDYSNDSFMNTNIENIFDNLSLCDEDKVLLLFRRLMEEWKLENKAQEEELLKTVSGRKQIATVQQSEKYLRPLFKSLKQRTLSKDILENLIEVVDAIVTKNYTEAGNYYIQMAVGNAPWPIGVTMVGIHERSAREKIFSNQVAHVLNDEVQRKYIQSVYRLIKFCQRKYPAAPSKSIG